MEYRTRKYEHQMLYYFQINTGANGLQRLDAVVKAAEKYGIKLIIPFVNNWSDYGGMPAYNTYFNTTSATWYTSAAAQAQYRKYITTVVSRYKNSETIFAWELGNEPRCQQCATPVITNWARDVSGFIKSLDRVHMVALGDEGWMNGGGDGTYPYTTWEGVDFEEVLKLPVRHQYALLSITLTNLEIRTSTLEHSIFTL
jgi:mannan endo-1,4-beta-mannosidase